MKTVLIGLVWIIAFSGLISFYVTRCFSKAFNCYFSLLSAIHCAVINVRFYFWECPALNIFRFSRSSITTAKYHLLSSRPWIFHEWTELQRKNITKFVEQVSFHTSRVNLGDQGKRFAPQGMFCSRRYVLLHKVRFAPQSTFCSTKYVLLHKVCKTCVEALTSM